MPRDLPADDMIRCPCRLSVPKQYGVIELFTFVYGETELAGTMARYPGVYKRNASHGATPDVIPSRHKSCLPVLLQAQRHHTPRE